jgi:hypothetical protein
MLRIVNFCACLINPERVFSRRFAESEAYAIVRANQKSRAASLSDAAAKSFFDIQNRIPR